MELLSKGHNNKHIGSVFWLIAAPLITAQLLT